MKVRLSVLFIIFSLLISSCGAVSGSPVFITADEATIIPRVGEIWSMQIKSTLWGVEQVKNSMPFTHILTDGDDNYMFMWPLKNVQGYAWVSYNLGKEGFIEFTRNLSTVKGNLAEVSTAAELFNYLENKGWKPVNVNAVPSWFWTAVTLAQTATITLMNSLPTFMIVIMPTPPDAPINGKFENGGT